MLDLIMKIFRKSKDSESNFDNEDDEFSLNESDQPFIWCLVGNIIGEHQFGAAKEIKYGTKHFSTNTKVHCFPVLWGDGYENIKVIGRHRKSRKQICIIMPSKYICNWRIQKIYNPFIVDTMLSNNGWSNSDEDKKLIMELLESIKLSE